MSKILSHQETIASIVARHEAHIALEQSKAAARQAEIAASAEAEAAKLRPAKDALDALNHALGRLVRAHDELTERLRVGRIRLQQQEGFVAELDGMVRRIYEAPCNTTNPNPHDFWRQFELHPQLSHAHLFVPRLKDLVAETEDELAGVESELSALSQSARPPA